MRLQCGTTALLHFYTADRLASRGCGRIGGLHVAAFDSWGFREDAVALVVDVCDAGLFELGVDRLHLLVERSCSTKVLLLPSLLGAFPFWPATFMSPLTCCVCCVWSRTELRQWLPMR